MVLTGTGRAFCTGANLQGRGQQQQKPGRSNAGAALETGFHPFLRRIRNLHCPLVTAVNGPAAGAGMSFALLGDMILARALGLFPASVPPHRPRAGLRLDLAAAASRRQGALDRAVADGRAAAGREGAGMGPRQPRL